MLLCADMYVSQYRRTTEYVHPIAAAQCTGMGYSFTYCFAYAVLRIQSSRVLTAVLYYTLNIKVNYDQAGRWIM